MTKCKAKVIVNPVASGGRVGKRWPELDSLLAQGGLEFDAELTQHPGHATDIARTAVEQGFAHIICFGGDGTVHEVVNGLVMDGRIPSGTVLSIIPGGTGSDFVRILGISRDPREAWGQRLG